MHLKLEADILNSFSNFVVTDSLLFHLVFSPFIIFQLFLVVRNEICLLVFPGITNNFIYWYIVASCLRKFQWKHVMLLVDNFFFMRLVDNLFMLLIIFNHIYGYLGDESASSECEETRTLPNSGLFPNLQV
jgi:hypothetical protein